MTLYVSDLDGTLLNEKGELSNYSKTELNKLIKNGVNFTVATARTPATVVDILDGVDINLPVVLMNGVIIYDVNKEEYIKVCEIHKDIVKKIFCVLKKHEKNPLMYGIEDNHLYVYHKELLYKLEKDFYDQRKHKKQKTFIKVDEYESFMEKSKIINFLVFDKLELVKKLEKELSKIEDITVNYYEDIYEKGYYFLEIYSKNASKAKGIEMLSNYCDGKRIISFGDNINDIPMFELSSECYAVSNAVEELKNIATGVIGLNKDDEVVKFIIRDR